MSIDKNWKIEKKPWDINGLLSSMSAKVEKDLTNAEKRAESEVVLDKSISIAEQLNNPLNQNLDWLRSAFSKFISFRDFWVFKVSEWVIINIGWDWYKLWDETLDIIESNITTLQDWKLSEKWDDKLIKIWSYIFYLNWVSKLQNTTISQLITLNYNSFLITAQNIETKKAALITA